jgi:hypothetical protein
MSGKPLAFTHHSLLITHHFSRGGIEMADQNESEKQSGGQSSAPTTDKENQTGDPGRTPGKAEGDEETAEEALCDEKDKPLH